MALDRASPATHRCLRGERLHALCGRWASGQAQPWRVGPALASSDARLSCSGKSCRCVRSVWLHDGCGVISAAEDGVALQACCVQASAGSCAFWFRGIGTECARDEAQRVVDVGPDRRAPVRASAARRGGTIQPLAMCANVRVYGFMCPCRVPRRRATCGSWARPRRAWDAPPSRITTATGSHHNRSGIEPRLDSRVRIPKGAA